MFVQSCLNAGHRMASVAFVFPVRRSDPFECQPCGRCLVADGQGHQQHAIAIGDIGTHCIDRDRECEFALIDAHAPFIDQQFLNLLQHSTLVSMENEATIVGDFDQNVLGFQSSHRRCDHQALVCSVNLDRNMLLLHLFLHSIFPLPCFFPLDEVSSMPSALTGSYGALEKALCTRSFRRCLARKRWVLIVPIGMARISAISSYVISWRWRRINTMRYLAGSFSICSRTMVCRSRSSRISSTCLSLFTSSRIFSTCMAACKALSRLCCSSCRKEQL